jgi:hypothetical protein
MKLIFQSITSFVLLVTNCVAQQVPAVEVNIPYLVTFGKNGDKSWGDDDFSQTFFFVIPKYQKLPVYIRIFDPETSGANDEKKIEYNTKTQFSVYGGKTCFTDTAAQSYEPKGNYKSGNLLYTKKFGNEPIYDQDWYTFGPFNPTEGEYVDAYSGYIFKVIAEGISGDDGNLYRYFLSSSPTENKPIEGANAFTFEYTFRFDDNQSNLAHLYPYIEQNVIAVNISNFDFDDGEDINIVSVAKKGEFSKASGDNVWVKTTHQIVAAEKKTVLDVQFIRNKKLSVKNNNVSLYITNELGKGVPLYTVPIGGAPRTTRQLDLDPTHKQKVK